MPPVCHPCPASSPGLAVLRTPEPLALGHWHRVSAERLNKDGSLRVNSRRPVLRSSPGKSQGLNLHTLLYLGGVEPSVRLPPATNVSAHFRGCVGEVRSGLQRTRGEGRGGCRRAPLPAASPDASPWASLPSSVDQRQSCLPRRASRSSDCPDGGPWHTGGVRLRFLPRLR